MDSFEESVRRALQAPYVPDDVDPDDFLADVHRGARGRRTRQVVGGVVATVAVVTTGGYVAVASDVFPSSSVPVAGQSTVLTSPRVAVPTAPITASSSVGSPTTASSSAGSVAASSVSAEPSGSIEPASSPATAVVPPPTSVSPTAASGGSAGAVASPTIGALPSPSVPADTAVSSTAFGASEPTPSTAQVSQAQALSLSATGTQHQWVLLAAPDPNCPEQQCAVVQVTEDAGRSWKPLSAIDVGVSARPSGNTVHEVRFAGDGTNGWTFGGELLATHDAGASWTMPSLPVSGAVTSLEAWGDFVYAVIADEQQGVASLVRSPIGDDDWQQVDLGTDHAELSTLVVSKRVVAVLARPMNSDVGNLALVSSDGVSWQSHQPCEGGPFPSTLSAAENSLWVLCTDGTTAKARVSRDDGQTWADVPGDFSVGSQLAARDDSTAAVADPIDDGITLIGVGQAPVKVAVADLTNVGLAGFTNPTTGYVLDPNGQVLRTDDGGQTWQPYSLPD